MSLSLLEQFLLNALLLLELQLQVPLSLSLLTFFLFEGITTDDESFFHLLKDLLHLFTFGGFHLQLLIGLIYQHLLLFLSLTQLPSSIFILPLLLDLLHFSLHTGLVC